MRTYPDCYPCFLRQALSAARRAGASVEQQQRILLATMEELKSLGVDAPPVEMADGIHRMVRFETANLDPYAEAKKDATRKALALLPGLRQQARTAADPLATAVRIAIAGNIIDYGVAETFDLDATLERVLHQPLAVDDLSVLRTALAETDSVLYLADNAGETVFDRVLIEYLARPVTYAVKAGPIINDATREDALDAGLEELTEIIENGSDAPGTMMARCSKSFRERFEHARLIIAKGQANYETLSESPAPIVFLLQAKCDVVGAHIGAKQGDIIAKASRTLTSRIESARVSGVGAR